MRCALIVFFASLSLAAHASEVVWVSPPSAADAARVAEAARARGEPLRPIDLRAAPHRFGEDDREAWARLDRTLTEVRAFETRLDGEVLIARDLTEPIADITLLRSQADRDKLRRALAYQGFAVHRLAAGDLSIDEVEDYRVVLGGEPWVRPWVDAIALDPSYTITAYDIAEAPERVAYAKTAQAVSSALPASLTVPTLPDGAELWVDGAPVDVSASGVVRLPPGRHFLHVQDQDRVTQRWVVSLEPGGATSVELTPARALTDSALAALSPGPTPPGMVDAVRAYGGEVWVADRTSKGLRVHRVSPERVEVVPLVPARSASDEESLLSLAGSVGVGWMWSGDFLASHAGAPSNRATVNALMPELGVELALRTGLLAVDAGASVWLPLGEHHTARYGDRELRPRPMPYVAVGLPWVQVLGGYLFPHHPLVGLRAQIPIGELPLAIRAEARLAPAITWPDDPEPWRSHAVRSAGLSLVGTTGLW